VVTEALSQAYQHRALITSVTMACDMVPRFTRHSLHALLADVITFKQSQPQPKVSPPLPRLAYPCTHRHAAAHAPLHRLSRSRSCTPAPIISQPLMHPCPDYLAAAHALLRVPTALSHDPPPPFSFSPPLFLFSLPKRILPSHPPGASPKGFTPPLWTKSHPVAQV
jgi:hypothetical protein